MIYHNPNYLRDSTYIINKNQCQYNSVKMDSNVKKILQKKQIEEDDEEGTPLGDLYESKEKIINFS